MLSDSVHFENSLQIHINLIVFEFHPIEKNMSPNELPILLITANVGSIFEDPTNLFQQWMVQVYNKIRAQKPAFIGIHLQEVNNSLNEKK